MKIGKKIGDIITSDIEESDQKGYKMLFFVFWFLGEGK